MDEEQIKFVYYATKEFIYKLVRERVYGYVGVKYDKDKEEFYIQIKNNDMTFDWTIRNAWDVIATNGLAGKEVELLISQYRKAITNYYFK